MQLDFNPDESKYLIDTSALIRLESNFKYDNPVFKAIWDEIEDLIRNEHLKTIDFVEQEINSYEGQEDFLKNGLRNGRSFLLPRRMNKASMQRFQLLIKNINQAFLMLRS